jgi:hypothetical protein
MDKVNCTIPLAETQMEVFNGFLSGYGEVWTPTPAPVKVTMRLSPVQQVFIEIADMPVTLSGNLYNPGMISTLRLPSGPEIEVFTAQVLGMGDVNVSLLVPTRQPVTVIQTGENLVQRHQFPQLIFRSPPCVAARRAMARRNRAGLRIP